jgi:Protein of unknown function (DUF664)
VGPDESVAGRELVDQRVEVEVEHPAGGAHALPALGVVVDAEGDAAGADEDGAEQHLAEVGAVAFEPGPNLAGLVQHLTFVESKWFEGIVAGGAPSRGRRSMEFDPSVSLRALRSEYRAACDAINQIVTALGTADAPLTHNGKTRSLRWGDARRDPGHRAPRRSRGHHPRTNRWSNRC